MTDPHHAATEQHRIEREQERETVFDWIQQICEQDPAASQTTLTNVSRIGNAYRQLADALGRSSLKVSKCPTCRQTIFIDAGSVAALCVVCRDKGILNGQL